LSSATSKWAWTSLPERPFAGNKGIYQVSRYPEPGGCLKEMKKEAAGYGIFGASYKK